MQSLLAERADMCIKLDKNKVTIGKLSKVRGPEKEELDKLSAKRMRIMQKHLKGAK